MTHEKHWHFITVIRQKAGILVTASLLLAACAGDPIRPTMEVPVAPATGHTYKVGNPYKVLGKWYYPREDPYYDQVGIASWYGSKFNGRPTANGETFDMNGFSAAHKTLPMPSHVKVTNLGNGRTLVVRVNDRGPFVSGRIIDLSRRAAEELGFLEQGTARIRVQAVANSIGERFVVAKGTTSAAERRSVVAAPAKAVETSVLAEPPGNAVAPMRTAAIETAALRDNRGRGRGQGQEGALRPDTPPDPTPALLFVQAGAFSDLVNAHKLRDQLGTRLGAMGTVTVAPVLIGDTRYYRVRIGPLDTLEIADSTLIKVINHGHADARIVVDTKAGVCRVC